MTTHRSRKCRRRGAAAVLAAFCLLPLVMVTALVLEGGLLMSRRRQAQAAADASAHAAACLLAKNYVADAGLDPHGYARTAALGIAASNGFHNGDGTTTLTVNIPPAAGTFAGQAGNAEVLVTYSQPRSFSAVFGQGAISVTARGVGRAVLSKPASIILTETSAAGALTLTGSGRVTANGAIQVNSSNAAAVNASNSGYAADNGGMNVAGGYSIPGWAGPGVFFAQTPAVNQPTMADPYASLPAPNPASLGTGTRPARSYGANTIGPGVFDGGLTLGGGSTITMNPGTYYMRNGSFTVANGVVLRGTGVTIFSDGGGGGLSFQGGTNIMLTPPTSGPYSGIVYYQDRSNGVALNSIANGATVNMTGAVYAPKAAMSIAGGAAGSSYGTQFIVKSLSVSNGASISVVTPDSAIKTTSPFLSE